MENIFKLVIESAADMSVDELNDFLEYVVSMDSWLVDPRSQKDAEDFFKDMKLKEKRQVVEK